MLDIRNLLMTNTVCIKPIIFKPRRISQSIQHQVIINYCCNKHIIKMKGMHIQNQNAILIFSILKRIEVEYFCQLFIFIPFIVFTDAIVFSQCLPRDVQEIPSQISLSGGHCALRYSRTTSLFKISKKIIYLVAFLSLHTSWNQMMVPWKFSL